jgi:hypothetical protein
MGRNVGQFACRAHKAGVRGAVWACIGAALERLERFLEDSLGPRSGPSRGNFVLAECEK